MQKLKMWNGPTMPQPTKPGIYTAQAVSIDMLGHKMLTLPYEVEVVADVPNPRGHKLLVRTGCEHPKYAALDCYDWRL